MKVTCVDVRVDWDAIINVYGINLVFEETNKVLKAKGKGIDEIQVVNDSDYVIASTTSQDGQTGKNKVCTYMISFQYSHLSLLLASSRCSIQVRF